MSRDTAIRQVIYTFHAGLFSELSMSLEMRLRCQNETQVYI